MNRFRLFYRERVAPFRRQWQPWLTILVLAGIVSTIPFWLSDLDILAASYFYEPAESGMNWPHSKNPLWAFFYNTAPLFTTLLGLIGFGSIILGSFKPLWWRWRVYGLFIVLTLALGPGLLVNAMFKDHWGRPRPREIQAFGSDAAYFPPLAASFRADGKSFPCGHCSVAFAFGAFYFIMQRSHPVAAVAILSGSLATGGLVGMARMSAGGHFLSDTLWAGVMVYGVMILLYYFCLAIPSREGSPTFKRSRSHQTATPLKPWQMGAIGIAIMLLISASLLATPFEQTFRHTVPGHPGYPVVSVRIRAHAAKASLMASASQPEGLVLSGSYRGFGFPWSRISLIQTHSAEGHVQIVIMRRGIFTELAGKVQIIYNPTLIGDDVKVVD